MRIDLNSDLGESFGAWRMGDDEAILPLVTSANIACGFRAGDPAGILSTLKSAAAYQVSVGAHVSYPDRVGFGRRNMGISTDDLSADVIYQIGALQGLAAAAGTCVSYVKPHGAIYNTIACDAIQASAVIGAIISLDQMLSLILPASSPLEVWAQEAGLHIIREVFADRAYTPDGRPLPRTQPGALIHSAEEVVARITGLLKNGALTACDGSRLALKADSVCIHGHTPGSVEMAASVRRMLLSAGVTLAPAIQERK